MENENILVQIFENKLNQYKTKLIFLEKQICDKSNRYESVINQISLIDEMNASLQTQNNELDAQLIDRKSQSIDELIKQTKHLKLSNMKRLSEVEWMSSTISSIKTLVRSLRANQLNVSVSDCHQISCIELRNSSASQMTSLSQRIHSISQLFDQCLRDNRVTRNLVDVGFNLNVNVFDDHLEQLFGYISQQKVCLNKRLIELNNNCATSFENNKILVELKTQCEQQNKQINEMKKSLLELREQNNWLCDVLTEANFMDSVEEQQNHNKPNTDN